MATLAAFLLVVAAAALSLSAVTGVHLASVEHRARRESACARFAAIAGSVLGPSADQRPELVAVDVAELRVSAALDGRGRCGVTARAVCGEAIRSTSIAAANPLHCAP